MNNEAPALGKLLRDRRAHHGWTLADVSSMTGIAASTLSKIENGLLSPSFDKVLQLSRGLGVEIADLLDPQTAEANPPAVVLASPQHQPAVRGAEARHQLLHLHLSLLGRRP